MSVSAVLFWRDSLENEKRYCHSDGENIDCVWSMLMDEKRLTIIWISNVISSSCERFENILCIQINTKKFVATCVIWSEVQQDYHKMGHTVWWKPKSLPWILHNQWNIGLSLCVTDRSLMHNRNNSLPLLQWVARLYHFWYIQLVLRSLISNCSPNQWRIKCKIAEISLNSYQNKTFQKIH